MSLPNYYLAFSSFPVVCCHCEVSVPICVWEGTHHDSSLMTVDQERLRLEETAYMKGGISKQELIAASIYCNTPNTLTQSSSPNPPRWELRPPERPAFECWVHHPLCVTGFSGHGASSLTQSSSPNPSRWGLHPSARPAAECWVHHPLCDKGFSSRISLRGLPVGYIVHRAM